MWSPTHVSVLPSQPRPLTPYNKDYQRVYNLPLRTREFALDVNEMTLIRALQVLPRRRSVIVMIHRASAPRPTSMWGCEIILRLIQRGDIKMIRRAHSLSLRAGATTRPTMSQRRHLPASGDLVKHELDVGDVGEAPPISSTSSSSFIVSPKAGKRSRMQDTDGMLSDERSTTRPKKTQIVGTSSREEWKSLADDGIQHPIISPPAGPQAVRASRSRLEDNSTTTLVKQDGNLDSPPEGDKLALSLQLGLGEHNPETPTVCQEQPMNTHQPYQPAPPPGQNGFRLSSSSTGAGNAASETHQGESSNGDIKARDRDSLLRDIECHQANMKRLGERKAQNERDMGRLLVEADRYRKAAERRAEMIKQDNALARNEQLMYEQKASQLDSLVAHASESRRPS